VLVVAAVVVGVVLGLAVVTSLMPAGLQDVIFRTPLAIVILSIGTMEAWSAISSTVEACRRHPEERAITPYTGPVRTPTLRPVNAVG
jgi:hypothetical protein